MPSVYLIYSKELVHTLYLVSFLFFASEISTAANTEVKLLVTDAIFIFVEVVTGILPGRIQGGAPGLKLEKI